MSSETMVGRRIRKTESMLIKSTQLRLPEKKVLTASDHEFELVIVDATESAIERPKKSGARTNEFGLEPIYRSDCTLGRKRGTCKRAKSRSRRTQNKSWLPSLGLLDPLIVVCGKRAHFIELRAESFGWIRDTKTSRRCIPIPCSLKSEYETTVCLSKTNKTIGRKPDSECGWSKSLSSSNDPGGWQRNIGTEENAWVAASI